MAGQYFNWVLWGIISHTIIFTAGHCVFSSISMIFGNKADPAHAQTYLEDKVTIFVGKTSWNDPSSPLLYVENIFSSTYWTDYPSRGKDIVFLHLE